MKITNLQYADDTLVFCDVEEEQLKYLRVILILFEDISGLQINWRESYIYPINQVPNMEHLPIILGGEVGRLPTIYLGMAQGTKSKSKRYGT
uniref:Putative ovule protein n=1 Tax=Solanum chacoense TaxID=4108 RepID=A0A0V0HEM3_SOLCH